MTENDFLDAAINIKFGIFILVKTSKIEILNLKNGTLIKSFDINTGNIVIGDDQNLYFSDLNDHFYKSLSFRIKDQFLIKVSNGVNIKFEGEIGCQEYNFGVDSCISCSQNYTEVKQNSSKTFIICEENQNGSSNSTKILQIILHQILKKNFTSINFNGNNIPGFDLNNTIFLSEKKYSLELAETSDQRALIKFQNLDSTTPDEKQKYLRTFLSKNNEKIFFIFVNKEDKEWRQNDNIDMKVLEYPALWREGKLLLDINFKKSHEKLTTNFHLVAPDYISRDDRILPDFSLNNGTKIFPGNLKNRTKNFSSFQVILQCQNGTDS